MVGSSYTDLTFTNNAGVWTTNTGAANQSMTFNSATGTLSIIVVPEPGTLALAGFGIAAATWAFRRHKHKAGRSLS
jgi:cbb3-type cytochrome oxidase subunit 3